jgi:N-acyl amino acid synthase of PEP-CTERM/exosortase system
VFDSRFETFLADTELAKRIHYQIRYRIFCIDTGFEDPEAFQIEEERDQWDDNAVHFLVREKATQQWVATMRLVMADGATIPMETLCESSSQQVGRARETSAEVSRLCMVREYRGRQGTPLFQSQQREADGRLVSITDGLSRRAEPEIMLGLFRAAFAYSQEKAINRWFFLITPPLAKLVNRLGISLEQIGPKLAHRGTRVPYVADIAKGRMETMRKSEAVAAMLSRDVPHFYPFSSLVPDHEVA